MNHILWGIVLITLGVIFGLNALEITNINVFFHGWWTLFIIIPCLISLLNSKESKTGNIIGIVIGVALLLACNDIIVFDWIWKLFVPFIFVMIGLSLILKNSFNKKAKEKIKELNQNSNDKEYCATFGSQKLNFSGEKFTGGNLDAIFGGIECDLTDADIVDDVVINCSSIFGGITILVPNNVNVVVNATPIFGGVSNHCKNKNKEYTIYINATCMFGGIDIK